MSFNLKRLAEVIRTNATVPTQADFLATHTPFKRLRYTLSGLTEISARQIDEEAFLQDQLYNRKDDHQFIIVQGDNGSGKSHLIRWIKERYTSQADLDKEAVLFIMRDQNTLRGALEQIISADIFPPGMELKDIRKLVEANQHLSQEALKQNIAVQFAVAADNAPAEGVILEKRNIKRLYYFLTDQAVQDFLSQTGCVIDRIYRRLSSDGTARRQDDLEPRFLPVDLVVDRTLLDKMKREDSNKNAIRLAEDLFDSEKGPELREKLSRFLNQHLEFVVQSCTNLRSADLKDVFEQLRMELKFVGKNLTLFIEDITSFTGIDRALVDVLVTEPAGSARNEKFCRLISVVGVTNDYYNTTFSEHLKERITGRVLIDHATLNSPEELAEMAARYINAISLTAEGLENWVGGGAADVELPISREYFNHGWAVHQLGDGREFSIYPFNVSALSNMYYGLPARTQTPRRFLQDVISHTIKAHAICAEGEFPPPVQDFEGEFKIFQMKDPLHEQRANQQAGVYGERVVTLLRVWGNGSAEGREQGGAATVGGLTKDIFDSFKLPFIEGIRGQGQGPAQGGGGGGKTPGPVSDPGPVMPGTTTTPQPGTQPEPDKGEAEFKKTQTELEEWLKKEGKLKSFRDLREDVIRIFLDYIDWEAEGVSAPVVSAFLTTQRVSIEGQIGLSYDGFQISRSQHSRSALLALAAWRHLGKKSWSFESATGHLANLYSWLEEVKDKVVASLKFPPGEADGSWNLPRWGVLAHYHVLAFSGQALKDNSAEGVYDTIFQNPISLEPQDARSKEWGDLQDRLKKIDKDISKSHDLLKKYYNRMQVFVTATTEVYFIDAVPLLKIIEELRQGGWDLSAVDTAPVKKHNQDMLWVLSLKIISLLQAGAAQAQGAEVAKCALLLQDLDKYAGPEASDQDLGLLFKDMRNFLGNVLSGANEGYPDKDFRPLMDRHLTARRLSQGRQQMKVAVKAAGVEQLLILAGHPLQMVVPCLELLRQMEQLLDSKTQKFQTTLDSLAAQGSAGVNDIIGKAGGYLVTLRDAYKVIHQGVKP